MIDEPASEARAMGWLSFLYRTSGQLYFQTTHCLQTAWAAQHAFGGNGGMGRCSTLAAHGLRRTRTKTSQTPSDMSRRVVSRYEKCAARYLTVLIPPAATAISHQSTCAQSDSPAKILNLSTSQATPYNSRITALF